MANSMMANLPPINGLYVAFFAVMTYFFLGTCRHLSLGTHGVISLVRIFFNNKQMIYQSKQQSLFDKMIGKTIEKYAGVLYADTTLSSHETNDTDSLNMIYRNASFLSSNVDEAKVMIATSLGFITGLIHVTIFILNLQLSLSLSINIKDINVYSEWRSLY